MQIVFQDPFGSLNPRMRVGRIIARAARDLRATATPRAGGGGSAELLEVVGLDPAFADALSRTSSPAASASASASRPRSRCQPSLIVADEPVSALDVSVQAQVLNLLMELKRRFGLTYLFISHDLHVVLHMSDRVAVMYLGEIVEIGDARRRSTASPKHPYTQALLSAVPGRRSRAAPRAHRAHAARWRAPSPCPAGCRFHPRCPVAFDRCRVERPRLRPVAPGHLAACHLYPDG